MKIPQKFIIARIKWAHRDIREVLSDLGSAGSGSVELFLHDALRHYLAHAEGINAAIKFGSEYAKGMQATSAAVVVAPVAKVAEVQEPPKPRQKSLDELITGVIRRDDSLAT